MIIPTDLNFIRESNRMSRITRKPTKAEVIEYRRFMALESLSVDDMVRLASVIQPGAELRDKAGMGVHVGDYRAPEGCEGIRMNLVDILEVANRRRGQQPVAHQVYIMFMKLHPFSNGNGRSGRILWMWMMKEASRGFLHTFHNQTLAAA